MQERPKRLYERFGLTERDEIILWCRDDNEFLVAEPMDLVLDLIRLNEPGDAGRQA